MKEYSDYDLAKLACEKLLNIDFSKRPCDGRIDPINDWGVLGPLMFKYEVDTDHYQSTVSIASDYTNKPPIAVFSFDYDSYYEYRKSIIMCILKSKNII